MVASRTKICHTRQFFLSSNNFKIHFFRFQRNKVRNTPLEGYAWVFNYDWGSNRRNRRFPTWDFFSSYIWISMKFCVFKSLDTVRCRKRTHFTFEWNCQRLISIKFLSQFISNILKVNFNVSWCLFEPGWTRSVNEHSKQISIHPWLWSRGIWIFLGLLTGMKHGGHFH